MTSNLTAPPGMDTQMEQAADEIRRLKTCLSDLVGVFGFRAIWSGGEPSRIVSTLLDVLVGTLHVDFAYARYQDPIGGASVESVRVDRERSLAVTAPEFGRLLDAWLRDLPHTALLRIPNPIGKGHVSILAVRLGLQDEMGMVVAGSSRADFPLQTERLLVNVAANQAAIGLHEGRRLTQRAMELVAANEELNREIAERMRAEAERIKLEERLRQAEKMEAIGRFASGITHDFNNILGGIVAYGEMLFDEAPENTPRKRYAQNVLTAAMRGRDLVDQILAYTRSQRGKRMPTDVSRTVAEALELVRSSLRESIALHAAISDETLVVMGDATQLHQIVMNLCSNAIHAMKAGGPLRVAVSPLDVGADCALSHGMLTPGRYVRVSVEDGGCGMDEATLARIFEPFFTTKEVGRGTGLGLALVYAIVADACGVIDVKSVLGEGSTFAIHLPLADVIEGVAAAA